VDHGKTTLVHALTGVMTDRLPEEQRRGITIELGFAPWQINDELLVSIIDAPGHRKLVHHMIAGATGIDLVLLVVAADEGVMPQTREHVAACKLLGVRRAVVAVTKSDRVDEELAELAGEEVEELLVAHGIEATNVPCSAKTGDGIEALRDAVLSAIEQTAVRERTRRVRLSVDRVFTVKGAGTVVTGTLVEGALALGTPLRILGPEREHKATARALHVHGAPREEAKAPTRLAINLGGVSLDEVQRGDVITDDPDVSPSRVLDVWLQALEPMRRGSEATMFVGTGRSVAKVQPVAKTELLEEGGLARLRLNTPLIALGGDRFVLRGARVDGPTGAVIGGGVVLDVQPPKQVRAAKRTELLDALKREDAEAIVVALANERSPRSVMRSALPSRFAVSAKALEAAAAALVKRGELAAVGDGGWLSRGALELLQSRAIELVAGHHQKAPLDAGLKLQTLREQLTSMAGEDVCTELLERMTTGKKVALVLEGDSVRLPSFKGAAQNEEAAKALAGATRALEQAALQGMSEKAITDTLAIDAKQARALLAAVVRSEAAIKAGDLWFDAAAVQGLGVRLSTHFDAEPSLSIKQFKEMTGLGRKQTIPLLEHFDRIRVTKRQGSDRIKG